MDGLKIIVVPWVKCVVPHMKNDDWADYQVCPEIAKQEMQTRKKESKMPTHQGAEGSGMNQLISCDVVREPIIENLNKPNR